MRNAGERGDRQRGSPDALARGTAEGPARRHRAAGPQSQPANGGASLFTPAYRVSHSDDVDSGAPSRYSWEQQNQQPPGEPWPDEPGWRFGDEPGWPGPRASNAVRGFPPAPDEPPPVYPPGPFAAWNQHDGDSEQDEPTRRTDRSRQLAAASITPVEFDTDFSLPAIKDPIPSPRHSTGRPAEAATNEQIARPAHPGRTSRRASGRRSARQKPQVRSQPVRYAVAAAVLIIVAAALILFVIAPTRSGRPTAGHATSKRTTPASQSSSRPPGKWGFIGLQSTDTAPVTGTELFPISFPDAGITYLRVAVAERSRCRSALIGSGLQSAVHSAGCTQAVRATYVARAVKMMATIGVFNLKSATAATTAATAAGALAFVAQLKSKKGLAHRIGQGTGIEEAAVEGHYLLLGWAEYTGLSAPKRHAQRLALENFITVLIRNTASIALSYRMTNGNPLPPG